jgi:o-succinylbenzoate synthase
MKVTRIRWAAYRIPFKAPYETARGGASHRSGILLRLETDSGHEGLGEASLDPSITRGAIEALLPPLEALASALIDAQPDDVDSILEPYLVGDEAARAAHCAIETALADARARAAQLPLAALLQPAFEGTTPAYLSTVAVNATIAAHSLETAAAAALVARVAGFGCIKLKVGMEATIPGEVARVAAVREVIGSEIKLRLDANGAWDEATAVAAIRALAPYDIELIEQPVPGVDIEALGRIRNAVTTTIAADEALSDYASAERAMPHADVLVLKPMRLGGPSTANYLSRFATSSGLGTVVTTTIDTGIANAMALHLAASLPDEGRAHGLATASLLESDLLVQPLVIERGYMSLPAGPGLGVTLDEDALMRYSDGWHEVSP